MAAASKFVLKWHAALLEHEVVQSARAAIDRTMIECVNHSKRNHPNWQNRTGTAEGSVRILFRARRIGRGLVGGEWGSAGTDYAIFLELKHGPWLRGARDAEYPNLNKRFREEFAIRSKGLGA